MQSRSLHSHFVLPPPHPSPPLPQLLVRAPVRDFSQGRLLSHFNQYLALQGLPLLDERGYCHGLSMLWLLKMDQGQEGHFYLDIELFLKTAVEDLKFWNSKILHFITLINIGQNLRKYCSDLNYKNSDVILTLMNKAEQGYNPEQGLPKDYRLSYMMECTEKEMTTFSLSESLKTLSERNLLRINNLGTSTPHAVAIYKRNDLYFLYNANYLTGVAKQFVVGAELDLAKEIQNCLYNFPDQICPESMLLEFAIMRQKIQFAFNPPRVNPLLFKPIHQPIGPRLPTGYPAGPSTYRI